MAKTKKTASRRGKNEGSIYQLPNGKWICQVTAGYDNEGKRIRKSVTGNTRNEVAVKLNDMVSKVYKSGYINASSDNLETIMRHWLMIYKKSEVSSRTFEYNMKAANNHIFPEIGHMKLSEINTDVVQTFFSNLINKKKLAIETVKKIKFPLSQFFGYAVEKHYMEENPVAKTVLKTKDKDRTKKEVYKAVRKEDREAFMKAVNQHHVFKPLCLTAMFAGLRIGEVLALKWRDIDLENGVITIQNAITQIVDFDDEGNVIGRTTVIGDTKTAASERENPMPDILIEALKEYKERKMLEEALLKGKVTMTKPDDIIFSTNEGTLRTYWGTNTLFKRFLEKNNLNNKGIHFHTLRHTFSNMLWEAGENPKVIQGLMGHKDVKTTMIYNSVEKGDYGNSVSILNKIGKGTMEM